MTPYKTFHLLLNPIVNLTNVNLLTREKTNTITVNPNLFSKVMVGYISLCLNRIEVIFSNLNYDWDGCPTSPDFLKLSFSVVLPYAWPIVQKHLNHHFIPFKSQSSLFKWRPKLGPLGPTGQSRPMDLLPAGLLGVLEVGAATMHLHS